MKTLNLIFATILVNMFTLQTTAQSRKTYSSFVQLSVTTLHRSMPANNYSVILYKDGIKLDSIFQKESNSLDYILQVNQVYTLVFKKEGCENNVVLVNTVLPEGTKGFSGKTKELLVCFSSIFNKQLNDTDDFPNEVLILDKLQNNLISSESYQQFLKHNEKKPSLAYK